MNTKHIHDLTLRLCQAIDQNYEVVNMEAVTSVISTLEGTKITKEQLETTRLAKFINHLRRRTKDEHLARRAKSLLKKWREMVGIQQQQQHVNDPTPTNSSATLPSVSGHNTSLYQQQKLRSQSVSPATSSMHFDVLQHQSHSNSSQIVGVSSTPTAIAEQLPRVTNAISGSLASLSTASSSAYNTNKRIANIENQTERASGGAASHVKKQPTSFENVLGGFGVTDRSNVDITSDNSTYRNKLNKSVQQHVASQDAETFIIDQSSNSNSEKSLMLPLNSRPANIAPIIIDIQDSNSGSNLVIPITTNKPISNKLPITGPLRAQSVSLDSKLNTAISPLKQKKVKKDKRRKERNEFDIQGGIDAVGDSKVATVLLDETSSNQQPRRQPGESVEKYTSFVNEEKSRLAYPEILSLLDNSSMSSMFPPETTTHPIDEQNKVNFSASNSSRTSFNLSTSDLTFAGKFKPSSTLLPTTSSSDAVLYNPHRRTASPKNTSMNNFSLHSGPTTSKFTPFRDVGYNSNDSNSNSLASHTDLIDVVSNDKILHAQKKQDNLNLQHRAAPAINVLTQAASAANVPPPKLQASSNCDATSNAPVSPEKKVPRKRGRKKGSKGVDSIIAKETSLSSQMLISSLGLGNKKVKTTKELYAEMQNRKLGIPTSSPSPSSTCWQMSHQQQQQSSRPTSSCSEPSLQSPHTFDACSTNATMSTIATRSTPENFLTNAHAGECETTSDTGTSEPSRDSSAIPKLLKRSLSIDSNSNIQQAPEVKINANSPAECNKSSDTSNQIAAIEKQLVELLTKLPPVPLPNAIQLKCAAELVPCTCKVIEISPTDISAENELKQVAGKENEQAPNGHERIEQLDTFISKHETNGDKTLDTEKNILKLLPTNSPLPPAVPKPKPKKSIFDLDFDEDEDPLPKIIAEAAAASLKKEQERITEVKEEPENDETTVGALQQSQTNDYNVPVEHTVTQLVEEFPMPILPTYEVEEDPHCVAKERFDLQTQKITKFHIDALHNCYIPHVNGNWDDSNYTIAQNMTLNDITTDVEHGYVITDGSNVVPKYGSLATERIPKDLSHTNLFEFNAMPKETTATTQMCTIPFLGVARTMLRDRFKLKTHNHKTCHKAKVTSLDECAGYHSGGSAVEYRRTEEYKTDETGISISVMTQNIKQMANENVTADDVVSVSKGLKDICKQLNDSVHGLTKPYDVTVDAIVNKNNNNNNNNVMLKDITIDVDGHGADLFMTQANVLNESERNGQNLLAIADHLDYSTNISGNTPLPQTNTVVICDNMEANNMPQVVEGYSEECRATVDTASNAFLANILLPVVAEESNENNVDNAYSRRSSSCSNSSLKQTQQSINLKLKHQFQHKTIVDANGERKRKRRKGIRRSVGENLQDASAVQDNKQSRIKRLKIAINGKVTTQMQFTGNSSNNSSDEDNEAQLTDNNVGNEVVHIDEYNESAPMDGVELVENTPLTSPGSHNSTYNQCNVASGDDELCANSRENNYNEEQEMDYDYYGDAEIDGDVEFDEYEDVDEYSGDFHEVVTRDISASSTGNNHIVLTIKKTPSKTNSPSNSLSAMSPNNASSQMYGAQVAAVNISPIVAKTTTVQSTNTLGDVDINALIVKKLEVCETKNNAETTKQLLDTVKLTTTEEMQPQLPNEVELVGTQSKFVSVKSSPKNSLELSDPENCGSAPITNRVQSVGNRKQQHRRRKLRKCATKYGALSGDIKLHRDLFFQHEVFVTDAAGVKQSILNFSSCSSSCADDSDYDHCNDLTEASVNSTEKFGAEIVNKLGELKKECYATEMFEATQQCKRALSASPCSTYSSCCNVSIENGVITACGTDNNARVDCADLKTQIGVVGCDIGPDMHVVKTDVVEDNKEFEVHTVNTVNSNTNSIPTLAVATDNNLADNVNEKLPFENNGLLYSFNNIYYTKDKLEAQTNHATMNNGILLDVRSGQMLSDIGDADTAAVYAAKEQEQIMLPNKNCDDYNNIYNKNINTINLIRYYINDPSLKTHVNSNKQCGNYMNIDDAGNVNTDAAAHLQYADNDNDNKAGINVGCTANIVQKADNSVQRFNNSGANDEKPIIEPSAETRCTQVMVPHKENRTGLRAVDEDVNDEDGNNCARIQQFREWHQVLQLRSYNDELLTVLPYVVLD
ncbi:mediator of RNA polymerase II transcription subunit 26 isoform X1 [Zeugodacus cucurbitae]|uniref:Mediator of RNA polymerase II transcription subunit 26 n=2 Tax=Zeugodacus cucurbitae TaxID=28588 RepID=A0A0A1WPG2_ZEUCU|nr:mediator of RNA polymerase II transcription subunit 26 isoform X1 [Zeugodacus cucurbitae]XP_011195012.2 mediator of RNA polymerase II transcription subunit 26 isoform X1 [Zeugodacus cucurbitae]XP_011195013.2 mediator of RNA polymerase II transcription subunit 26 isoform X1 [Zeugodacus cucurbitae]XP_011195015.2 mediator of RNA polymerase II transcription subunit 26 isoform X1 [Zeugodacus cucurbitae]